MPKSTASATVPATSNRHIGGSLLPSSEQRILMVFPGEYAAFQVRALPELDAHGLFIVSVGHENYPEAEELLVTHPNGYSCHSLAERILSVWSGAQEVAYAMAQFDNILSCGGLGKSRNYIEYITRGCPPVDLNPHCT